MTTPSKQETPKHRGPRLTSTVLGAAGGVLLAVLAIVSVAVTAHSNHTNQILTQCGVQAVQQTIAALQARDAAQRESVKNNIAVVTERREAIDALFDQSGETPEHLRMVKQTYDDSVTTYLATLNAFSNTLNTAVLPTDTCLNQYLRK